MPSDRRIVRFRPDTSEENMLSFLTNKNGLSMSRTIAVALRKHAEQEGYHSELADATIKKYTEHIKI